MTPPLKAHHVILSIIAILVCALLVIAYGWTGYSTLAEREGLRGNQYVYYNLTKPQFYTYNFIVAIGAAILIFCLLKYLIARNGKYVAWTCTAFFVFILLVLIFENYLDWRYVPKG